MCISTPRSNLVVRFLSVFLLCCTSLYASVDQTGKQKVTVVGTDVTLETVFRQIEKQTGLRFMYAVDAVDVKEKVTVMFEKVMLDEVLESLLGKKGIEWVYREGGISLRTKFHVNAQKGNSNLGDSLFKVAGKVVDAAGEPVPGATVIIKGKKAGTKTDGTGYFSLQNVDSNERLIISAVGFETKDVIAAKSITIKMNQVISTLDETIIKGGYYNTTQRFNTGNVTSIKAKDIEKQPVSDPLLALQGRVPGMMVTQTTGLSGGLVKVQIRGLNSIKNGTQPLFVVDGVPYQSDVVAPPLGGYGALGTIISALNFINPTDIETIDVLKDADATAIYGSRGANGVILITTKRGKIGNTVVDVKIDRGWQELTEARKLLNTDEYLKMRREAFINDGETPNQGNAPDLLVWDTTRYTNWQKEMLGKSTHYTDALASISGGAATVQYLIGGNYHKETTPFSNTFYSNRKGAHFNLIGGTVDQRLKSTLTGSYTINETNFPGADFSYYVDLPPNAPALYNPDGSLNWANSTWVNPYSSLINNVLDAQTINLVTNIDVNYKVINGLTVKANLGYNELRNNTFAGQLIAGVDPKNRNAARASATFTNSRIRSWIMEPQINYNRTWNRHDFNFLIGATLTGRKSDGQTLMTGGITQDALVRFPGAAKTFLARGIGTASKYIAFFGRLGYNFDNKYLINLTLRRDGSSRFGPRKQFATFGSIGAGWLFSQEAFIKRAIPFMSFGKLRASYGVTGNDQIGDYQYLDQYTFVDDTYQGEKGLRVVGLYNPDFVWEKTEKHEIGIEIGFIKDRLFFSASYYQTTSGNQLLSYPLPSMTGYSSITGNQPIEIRNRGLEFLVTSRNLELKNFSWTTSFNIAKNRNKIQRDEQGLLGKNRVGKSLSLIFLNKNVGVDKQTGRYTFLDVNGKTDYESAADNYAASVDIAPAFLGGIQNTFTYRRFSLDIFFQFVKQKGKETLFGDNWIPGQMRNQSPVINERWRKEGDDSRFQRMSQNFNWAPDFRAWLNSDHNYGDASFIRCKNLALSWQLPNVWRKKMSIRGMRIYLQGQNLFVITKYKGWDAETQSLTALPPLRTFTFGFQLSL